ncbi:MAG TPA: heavy-metal-associated domain-containing protein [Burkholderiaceae bacterium]|nr:heavy-metal-associated domain-containing protein [Burkholderiaceae bacterium]
MQQVLRIAGMHCAACVQRVTRALESLTPAVTVSLDPPRAVLDVAERLPLEQLAAAVARAGAYQIEAVD